MSQQKNVTDFLSRHHHNSNNNNWSFLVFSSLVRRKVFLVDSKIDLNHERMEI